MNRLKVNQSTALVIFLIVDLVTSGIVIAVINFNFQIASDQRTQTLQLTEEIHQSDQRNMKIRDAEQKAIATRQGQILENQKLILNTLKLHYNQTSDLLAGEAKEIGFHDKLNTSNIGPMLSK